MFKLGVTTLVLRKFTISDQGTDGPALEIVGRASGFVAWLLTTMKLNTLTTLRLQGNELSIVSGSLSGETHTLIPVTSIESTQCGHSKKLIYLYVAIAAVLLGLSTGELVPFLGSLVLSAIFGALYYFSNQMFIEVSAGTRTEIIAYKKGLVDGETVDLERTLEAINVINSSVIEKASA